MECLKRARRYAVFLNAEVESPNCWLASGGFVDALQRTDAGRTAAGAPGGSQLHRVSEAAWTWHVHGDRSTAGVKHFYTLNSG